MKNKGFVLAFSIFIISISLFGCAHKAEYQLSRSHEDIVQIEIIEVEPGKEHQVLKTLLPEEHDAFISKFSVIQWHWRTAPSDTLQGTSIKFTYSDGTYEIITVTGYYLSETGKYDGWICVDGVQYVELLTSYGVENIIYSYNIYDDGVSYTYPSYD